EAWRRTEERRFQAQFREALEQVRAELTHELRRLPLALEPLCAHDPIVDSALVGLSAGDLERRRLSIGLRVPALARACDFDELLLVTHAGDVLGAHADGAVGRRDAELVARAERSAAGLRRDGPLAVEAACVRRGRARPEPWVAPIGARHVEPPIARIGGVDGNGR